MKWSRRFESICCIAYTMLGFLNIHIEFLQIHWLFHQTYKCARNVSNSNIMYLKAASPIGIKYFNTFLEKTSGMRPLKKSAHYVWSSHRGEFSFPVYFVSFLLIHCISQNKTQGVKICSRHDELRFIECKLHWSIECCFKIFLPKLDMLRWQSHCSLS